MRGDGRCASRRSRCLKFGGDDPIGALADALAEVAPELCDGAIAIVDSPRSPLDLDCSKTFFRQMVPQKARTIDIELRRLVRWLNENPVRDCKLRLSLFPSPMAKYFSTARLIRTASLI